MVFRFYSLINIDRYEVDNLCIVPLSQISRLSLLVIFKNARNCHLSNYNCGNYPKGTFAGEFLYFIPISEL